MTAEEEVELIIDDITFTKFTPELKEKIEAIKQLEYISANNCGLTTLKDFPICDQLSKLELGENPFPASELVHISGLKELESLVLHECQIQSIDDLEPLKGLSNLYALDIAQTPLSEQENYREKIFKAFP